MKTITLEKSQKATLVPLDHVSGDLELPQPLQVAESLNFENVEHILKPELFRLWKDMVSKRERDDLGRSRFALIHRFQSSGHIGREEADSADLAFKVFLCLRLIKPTKSSFQRIQVKFLASEEPEVLSFQHPSLSPNVPDAESINVIELNDIAQLQRLLPSFLMLAAKGPENIRRAVRHFNVGYTELQDPTAQIVTWTMGIEALFTTEEAPLSPKQLIARVNATVGSSADIYEGSSMREYIGKEPFRVGDLIGDLLSLRNRFVHGQWIPAEWKDKKGRNSVVGGPINYADVLREAASFTLRRGILKHLEETNTTN